MATTSSPSPILFSVLSSSHDTNDDFVNQLRNHLTQIETNVQQSLNKIQQRKPFTSHGTNTNNIDQTIRKNFFHRLKDVATKNNQAFDEPFFRQQFLEKQDSSPKVDIVRAKPLITNDADDHHLSPINNTRRSQFAPVLSSTPVHQTSPITPIPVDLSMATPSVAPPVLIINSTDVPPSAIFHQRANINRNAARPPRIPRAESATRQKKNPSPIKEQQEDVAITKEIILTSKRRIKTKDEFVEDNVQVIIEQQSEIISGIINQVQATPLRGRKKKVIQEDMTHIPQLEPPPPMVAENETIPKKTRIGRNKKKEEQEEVINTNKPTRTASLRNRKKLEEVEIPPPPPPKKTTRNKKMIEPVINTVESLPVTKVRATPSRGKKKSPLEILEPAVPSTPKKATNKSKKRKGNGDTNENAIDTIQPPSPKRRGGRNTKTTNLSPPETIVLSSSIEQEPQQAVSVRSSRRGKKNIEIPIEKQEEIVLTKKPRGGRGRKPNGPINTDIPVTVVDVVMTSVTKSASIPSSLSIDSLVAKPPRPPVARKKKSIAMAPLPQMSPTTPPSTQRIQSTSPVNNKVLLPLPVPTKYGRRRQPQRRIATSPLRTDVSLETLPSTNQNQKRTRSSVATTPKRARRDNLVLTIAPGTPGKKRNKCTCEKRRNGICDICASATDV